MNEIPQVEEMYFFISSDDSKDLYPGNTGNNFVIELPSVVKLEGDNWYCALTEIKFEDLSEPLLVCSDICEESYVRGRKLPILRVVYESSRFDAPYYHRVNRKDLQRIHIRVLDSNLKPVLALQELHCTLHLTKWRT